MAKMGDYRNVTVSLPRDLLKRAKIMAAGMDKSFTQLLREALEARLTQAGAFKQAKARQLRLLKEGVDLGTGGLRPCTREELHER